MPTNPLCVFDRVCRRGEMRTLLNDAPRQRGGRIVYGPPRDLGDCVNRTMRCDACGVTGEESRRKDLMPASGPQLTLF